MRYLTPLSSKGQIFDCALTAFQRLAITFRAPPGKSGSIFVLRNNDLGDVLVTTPLFEALRHRFPSARISVGLGDWARDILVNNPYISDTVAINAPWANKYTPKTGVAAALAYIISSREARHLARQRFDVGVDLFGFSLGMTLLIRAGIKYRVGVSGAYGGEGAAHWNVSFDRTEHVSKANLRVAAHLLDGVLPEPMPQIFLSDSEREFGESMWANEFGSSPSKRRRVIVAYAAGLPEKCWPRERFAELVRRLAGVGNADVALVGGQKEHESSEDLVTARQHVRSWAGRLTLRETFAVVASCDLIICNGSMLMHAAAAFRRPTIVVLGPCFKSASAYEALWGYPNLGPTLGMEAGRLEMATVEEVVSEAQQLLSRGVLR